MISECEEEFTFEVVPDNRDLNAYDWYFKNLRYNMSLK